MSASRENRENDQELPHAIDPPVSEAVKLQLDTPQCIVFGSDRRNKYSSFNFCAQCNDWEKPESYKAAKKNSEIFMVRTTVHLLMNAARAASLDLGLAMQLDGTARINIEGLPILFTGVVDVAQVWGDTAQVTRITPPLPDHPPTITRSIFDHSSIIYLAVTRPFFDHSSTIARLVIGRYSTIPRPLLDHYPP